MRLSIATKARRFSVYTALFLCSVAVLASNRLDVAAIYRPAGPAGVIRVTSLADDGPGSLRAALRQAENGDTIEFAVSGTVELDSELLVETDVTIRGPGPGPDAIVLSGQDAHRVIRGRRPAPREPRPEIRLELLTVTRGRADGSGGGVFTSGRLLVVDCEVSRNYATYGGGLSAEDLYLRGSMVKGNVAEVQGGGIKVVHATVYDSSIFGNQVTGIYPRVAGGGAYLSGKGLVVRTLISSNSAKSGAGVWNGGQLTVANSTVGGNTAQGVQRGDYYDAGVGGGLHNAGRMYIINSTVSGNSADEGGGLVAGEIEEGKPAINPAELVNTIVADNGGGNCQGEVTDNGHNLQYPGASCGASVPSLEPMLGPPQDNGGPTLTMLPLAGSPAIDAGDANACSSEPVAGRDQRGFARPVLGDPGSCDIGAAEADSSAKPTPGYTPAPSTPVPADLIVAGPFAIGLKSWSGCWKPSDPYGLAGGVANVGGGDALPFDVEVVDRGTEKRRERVEGLAAGERTSLFYSGLTARTTYTMTVDVANEVDESNEDNNVGSGVPIVGTMPIACSDATATAAAETATAASLPPTATPSPTPSPTSSRFPRDGLSQLVFIPWSSTP